MILLHNATIVTAEKEAVGSILVKDGKIDTILYKEEAEYIPQVLSLLKNKPEVLELVARKAAAKLGRPINVVASDKTQTQKEQLERLLAFGRAHADVINIKD